MIPGQRTVSFLVSRFPPPEIWDKCFEQLCHRGSLIVQRCNGSCFPDVTIDDTRCQPEQWSKSGRVSLKRPCMTDFFI